MQSGSWGRRNRVRRACVFLSLALGGPVLASCGHSGANTARIAATIRVETPAHGAETVVTVGNYDISSTTLAHWMAIGEATVEKPPPSGPLPKVVAYRPPEFTACVAHLRARAGASMASGSLRAECKRIYEGIRARVLSFLITGYWLRGEAAETHTLVSGAEVRKKFEQERRINYPTPASFRRLEEASRQTAPDLEFAVETQILSTKLLARFATAGHFSSEQAAVAAFNQHMQRTWTPRTSCQVAYVIKDCKELPR
jgi:hypothetical protein